VSVVVPFRGDRDDAAALVRALSRLTLGRGDELVVADNTDDQIVAAHAGRGVTIVAATELRSSYYARNLGAEAARNDWILFIDADCRPAPSLLDAYFTEPVPDDWGAIAGRIEVARGQYGVLARYAASRNHLRQAAILEHAYRPMIVTANVLVRRTAWAQLGGFHEGIRSAGDSDFSWRLQDAGWRLGYRAGAVVEHEFRESLGALARQFARYGAGGAWVKRRHPGYPYPYTARELARCLVGVPVWLVAGQPRRALFKAIDGVVIVAGAAGWLMGNVSPAPTPPDAGGGATPVADGLPLLVLIDVFPELTETFVVSELRALQRAGHRVRVEAGGRAQRPGWGPARGLRVNYLEDDGIARKAWDLASLLVRNPRGCLEDLRARRVWRREEEVWPLRSLAPVIRRLRQGGETHVHAYFASGSALNALRISGFTGVPYSVTAYAYEIFRRPRNLDAKLGRAAFVATVSQNGVTHLRGLLGANGRGRVELVGMGVDGERFRRRRPHPGDGRILAVGRLVEKKGFGVLVDAMARLRAGGRTGRLVIAGDGPLRSDLAEQLRRLELEDTVELIGARDHGGVRDLMEEADLFAMPCVVASDGDQDSLPAVVSEALAMELPVVGSDVAGLPELVRPQWGRIVPSGDADALARAIAELLDLDPEARAAMGRAGRDWILGERDPDREAAKLAGLVAGAAQRTK